MANWNYRQIVAMLSSGKLLDFQGNTMRGMWVTRKNDAGEEYTVYRIWSYSTTIAEFDPRTGWRLDQTKYSPTTSKHQGYIRRSLGVV